MEWGYNFFNYFAASSLELVGNSLYSNAPYSYKTSLFLNFYMYREGSLVTSSCGSLGYLNLLCGLVFKISNDKGDHSACCALLITCDTRARHYLWSTFVIFLWLMWWPDHLVHQKVMALALVCLYRCLYLFFPYT